MSLLLGFEWIYACVGYLVCTRCTRFFSVSNGFTRVLGYKVHQSVVMVKLVYTGL